MAGQLIQYIVVRADLLKTLNWPVGAVIAQACHACCAVTYLFRNDPHTEEYLKDLDNMHKVVLEQVPDESSLHNLESKLKEDNILHKMWTEQPENFPTCIVVKPYPKEVVQKYFRKLKLFKG